MQLSCLPTEHTFPCVGFFIWTSMDGWTDGSWIGILEINGNGQSEANKGFDRSALTDTQTHSLPYLIASLHFFSLCALEWAREAGRGLILKRRIKIAPVTPLQKFLSSSFFYQWKRERKRERERWKERKRVAFWYPEKEEMRMRRETASGCKMGFQTIEQTCLGRFL